MDVKKLWLAVLEELEKKISRGHLFTYFAETRLMEVVEGKAIVGTPNPFTLETLKTRYSTEIFEALKRVEPRIVQLDFSIVTADPSQKKEAQKHLDREKPHIVEAVEGVSTKFLNQNYRMENFIVGPHNELAMAVAKKVVAEPGMVYNPLFIYGGVGLGKTHLLQAIGNELISKDSKKKVVYTTTEQFMNDLLEALQKTRGEIFRKKYRTIDLLIIDDIQFLFGREKTQEEFFHTFNTLHDHQKQIIISADRPPHELKGIMERLISRFQSGMIAEISEPDVNTRIAILQKKIQEQGLLIDNSLVEYIANNFEGSIREMEGILQQALAHLDLNGELPQGKELSKLIPPKKGIPEITDVSTPQRVVENIAREFQVEPEEVIGDSRKSNVSLARQIAMYIIRKNMNRSYEDIGYMFSQRNHATVLHAVKKIENLSQNDPKILKLLRKFEQ